MRRLLVSLWLCAFLAATAAPRGAAGRNLRFYFIDVEGGQSTLIVTPEGRSLLVDTGWPGFDGRDAERIVTAAHEAGLKRIDDVLITHFHADHVGGVPQLAERIPISNFYDHGMDVEISAQANEIYSSYLKVATKSRRHITRPGEHIPLPGVSIVLLTANGERIRKPLAGAGQPNPYCNGVKLMAADLTENARSNGFLLSYGKFRFVDLGDLTWDKELALMCPSNPIGHVEVFLVSHHGMNISNSPALVWALHPRVAIMNNGAKKGGTPEAWDVVEKSPGLENLWQLHYSLAGGPSHNVPEDYIANAAGPDHGYDIELVARPDGSFTVTNSRKGFSKSYPAR